MLRHKTAGLRKVVLTPVKLGKLIFRIAYFVILDIKCINLSLNPDGWLSDQACGFSHMVCRSIAEDHLFSE